MDSVLYFIKDIVNSVPYGKHTILALLIILIFIAIYFTIIRFMQGDNVTLLWEMISLQPNKVIDELKKSCDSYRSQFEEINQIAEQKNNILKHVYDVSTEITTLMNIRNRSTFTQRKNKLLDMILYFISSNLTKQKENFHRVAIFIPDKNSKHLRIYRAMGYSAEGVTKLRLPISNSFAGQVFRTGKPLNSGQVQKEKIYLKIPETKTEYKSLVCVPIIVNGECRGVLSMDGKQSNSFDLDDADYLRYFAGLIGEIFKLEEVNDDICTIEEERRAIADEKNQIKEGSSIS